MNEFWCLRRPPSLPHLRYGPDEDMKMDIECCVKKLAEFMVDIFLSSSEEERQCVVQEIIHLCNFKNLTSLEVNKASDNKEYFRRREVGDSQNYLTPEMLERLDEITEEMLERLDEITEEKLGASG